MISWTIKTLSTLWDYFSWTIYNWHMSSLSSPVAPNFFFTVPNYFSYINLYTFYKSKRRSSLDYCSHISGKLQQLWIFSILFRKKQTLKLILINSTLKILPFNYDYFNEIWTYIFELVKKKRWTYWIYHISCGNYRNN